MEFGPMVGVADPPSAQAFKRGVMKAAPKEFTVEVLVPAKHGGAFSYGLKIFPSSLRSDRYSVRSENSWTSDYEIWRRWEDCLYFQEVLEDEYAQMSREKRKRLKSGKGIKKDGVYKKSDFAASFDSLPAGPDHRDIATDVHEHIPKLNKKGTLFRPSPSVVNQRGKEFSDLINALFQDDSPTLIHELREQMRVRDFFGFWRRDEDRLRKSGVSGPDKTHSLYSTASASAVSLAPTSSGMSVRSSFMSPMFLRLKNDGRPPTSPGELSTTFADDAFSIIDVPPYSPGPPSIPPKSPARRRRNSRGDQTSTPSTPRTPQIQSAQQPEELSDDASMKFVFGPGDMMLHGEDGINEGELVQPDSPALVTPPAASAGPDVLHTQQQQMRAIPPRPPPPAFTQNALPPPPRSTQVAQGTFAPPPSVTARVTPRYVSPVSPSSKANRNCRVFAPSPTSPEDDGQFVIYSNDRRNAFEPLTPDSPVYPVQNSVQCKPDLYIQSTHSPIGVSPPHSATNSIDSASSGEAGTSVFTESDSSSSSRRSSWETSNSSAPLDATMQPLGVVKGKEKEHVGMGDRSAEPSAQSRPAPPVSYRNPHGHFSAEEMRHSASSLETVVRGCNLRSRSPMLQRAKPPPPSLIRPPSPNESVDVLDSYFDNLTISKSEDTESVSGRPTSVISSIAPSFTSKRDEHHTSRESINFQPPTPDRFPAPFQHRPPGQFHLPWSPTHPAHTPPYQGVFPSAQPQKIIGDSNTFVIKVMYDDAIVVLKVDRTMSLEDVRRKIHDKFAKQEDIPLDEHFVLSYKHSKSLGGGRPGMRPRSNSTSTVSTVSTMSSMSTIDPSQLSFLVLEKEWRDIVASCGPKLTLIVLDS